MNADSAEKFQKISSIAYRHYLDRLVLAAVTRLFSSVTASESQASLRSLRVIRRLMPMGGFAPIYESGLGGICRPPSVPVGRAVLG